MTAQPSATQEKSQHLLESVAINFDQLIGQLGKHAILVGDEVYIQPSVYLTFHWLQMLSAGWQDCDFDQLAVVSGASALFAHQPGEFRPKYAHLSIVIDQRIAEATGFGYEWVNFSGIDGAWELLVASVDGGRPLKGWDWENILFAGYQEATRIEDRKIFAMADGPEHYARWLSWELFGEWVDRVTGWNCPALGRHTARVESKPAEEIALQVIGNLVEWSTNPPKNIRNQYPKAFFGLEGIDAYAHNCADTDKFPDWQACHDVNGQWALRNSTSNYLRRIAVAAFFSIEVNQLLLEAAKAFRKAYESWEEVYRLLGHGASEEERHDRAHREQGAAGRNI